MSLTSLAYRLYFFCSIVIFFKFKVCCVLNSLDSSTDVNFTQILCFCSQANMASRLVCTCSFNNCIVISSFVIFPKHIRHSLPKLLYNTHSWAPIHQQLVRETKRELMKASLWKIVRVVLGQKNLWTFPLFSSCYFPWLYCVDFSVTSCINCFTLLVSFIGSYLNLL